MIKKPIIMQLALLTLVGMPLIAIIIDRFSERVDLAEMVMGKADWWIQIAAGIGAGLAAGFAAKGIISLPFMEKVSVKYSAFLGNFHLTWSEIFFISFCAGVGEEILFRGAIQPFFGIIMTAVVFVAIHGYLNPKDWRLSVYGICMTLFIAGIGWMAEAVGLVSAMIAHMLIDVVLLQNLQQTATKLPSEGLKNTMMLDKDEQEN